MNVNNTSKKKKNNGKRQKLAKKPKNKTGIHFLSFFFLLESFYRFCNLFIFEFFIIIGVFQYVLGQNLMPF